MQNTESNISDPTLLGQAYLEKTLAYLGNDPTRPLLEAASAEYWLMHGERIHSSLSEGASPTDVMDATAKIYGDSLARAMVRAAADVLAKPECAVA